MEIGTFVPNEDLEVSRNTFVQTLTGVTSTAITTNTTPTGGLNERVLISDNTITGYGNGIAVGGPPFIASPSLD